MYVIKVFNKYPKRNNWVGSASPVSRRKEAMVFQTRQEAQLCVADLKKAYKQIDARILPV